MQKYESPRPFAGFLDHCFSQLLKIASNDSIARQFSKILEIKSAAQAGQNSSHHSTNSHHST